VGAHSFLHVGDLWIFAIRESYSDELAAVFTDDQADPASDTSFYSSTVAVTRDRLNCLGITRHAAHAAISTLEREMVQYADRIGDEPEPFEVWLEAASIEAAGGTVEAGEAGEPPGWTWHLDPRVVLRPLLDRLPPDLPVELNLTEIVGRRWAPVDAVRCATALEDGDTPHGRGPMIVMTEGSTDAAVITAAIQVLAPHLMGYLRVLDYTLKPEGGAPALVRGIKAFASAGVRNNIVALFDNDTAAASALRALPERALPKNFRIVPLPELEIARTYPTSGPSGPASCDVNGDAVAIEMFFGEDVLRANGTLTPVLWRGWMDGADRYQGELANRPELRARFEDKVAKAIATGIDSTQDWAPLRLLLKRIIGAFDDAATSDDVATEPEAEPEYTPVP
jgi:hypothetical protein